MELKLRDINVCNFNKKLSTVCNVEADIIVPDTKPDIYRILCVNATADMDEHYIRKGKIVFSGNVKFNILYTGETDKTRIYNIEYSMPFNHQADFAGAEDDFKCITRCTVSGTDFKVKNSRKLSAKGELSIDAEVMNYTALNALEEVLGEDTVPSKQKNFKADSMVVCKDFAFSFSDSITLPSGDDVLDVLDFDVRMDTSEIKTVNNKAIIKGNLPAKIFYISGSEPSVYETEFSFTEIADLDMANSESMLSSHFNVSDVSYEVSKSDDEAVIDLDIKINGYIKAYEKQEYSVISDIYSPDYSYSVSKEKAQLESFVKANESQITVKDNLSSDLSGSISKIYYMNVYPSCSSVDCKNSSVKVSGSVQTSVLYSDEDGTICSSAKDIPYEFDIPFDHAEGGTSFDVSVSAVNYGYVLGGANEVQARIVLKAMLSGRTASDVNIITDFSEDKNSPVDKSSQPSITVCYPDGSATLWDYAVKYNTTCEEIASVNSIDLDSQLQSGVPILIPKRKI